MGGRGHFGERDSFYAISASANYELGGFARAVHPDKCNLEGAEEATKIIIMAAEVLGDPRRAREHERARVSKRAREQEPEVKAAQWARQQQRSGPSRDKPGQSKQQRRRERQGQNKRQ